MTSPNGFEIKFLFLAYVPPSNGTPGIALKSRVLKKVDKTSDYLLKIFDSAINDCKVGINFRSNGNQENEIRDNLIKIVSSKTNAQKAKYGRALAEKLHQVTDERNGSGLFVITEGIKQKTVRTTFCRFKGDEGLSSHGEKLDIEYLEELFTKKSKHYKLAVFEDIFSAKSFWNGFAIDRQVSGNTYRSLSYFWIEEFLEAQTEITSQQGTLQLSKIIRKILSSTDNLEDQEQIISAVVNLKSRRRDYQISVSDFCSTYLSEELAQRVKSETSEDFYNTVFTIDKDVYKKELGNTVLSLQDGITAYIPSWQYDKHVTEQINNDGSKNIVIEGKLEGKKIHSKRKEKETKQ